MRLAYATENASRHAADALSRLEELELPPTPVNFAVWFEYFAGTRPDLKRDIDGLLESGDCSDERCYDVFVRYFGQNESNVTEAAAGIERSIGNVLQQMAQAGQNATGYRDALSSLTEQLAKSESIPDIRQAVEDMTGKTAAMAARTQDLEDKLGESSKEITALRSQLESARMDALTDGLTGIANRKYFDLTLKQLAQAANDDERLSLLLLDIDRFKLFNDKYGHQLGDQVLRLVAQTLAQSLKGRDVPARYGGEEFGILLPQTALADAVTVADQVRRTISTKQIVRRNSGEALSRITVSVGVAEYRPGEEISDMVKRADQALYRAKNSGRDRVVAESEAVLSVVQSPSAAPNE